MKYTFSIIIPTYNGVKTIHRLLKKLQVSLVNYTNEVIVIDSGSTDGTIKIVKKYKKNGLNIHIIQINKKDFNHGLTRNIGIQAAQGEYLCFFSQDVLPIENEIFRYYLEDFNKFPNAVGVFGKNYPFPKTPIIQQIESDCRWERIDKYVDQNGILLQSLKTPFLPYIKKYHLEWYFFSNTASCYRRSFLANHLFIKVIHGEDIIMGRTIITSGFEKVYDKRCSVYHSHNLNIFEYFQRERNSLSTRIVKLHFDEKPNIWCKLRKIVLLHTTPIHKIKLLLTLAIYYVLKLLAIIQILLLELKK